ncbi:MAG: orotidine-5'-phosphate decarboxylase [Clostridia bacterium]|nr:orotidine-5'-phosphate decarboxylase [Clostridia bacterium]
MVAEAERLQAADRVIVALDVGTLAEAERLLDAILPVTRQVKVGMELYTAAGAEAVRLVRRRGGRVFLDMKFHDIPNTVAGAVRAAAALGAGMITVHVAGGRRMLEAAVRAAEEAAAEGSPRPRVLGVTVLTSMNAQDLEETGEVPPLSELVARRIRLAREAGLDGVVCSPLEARLVKAMGGRGFLAVTPGIRPSGAALGDQARAATPATAIANGADYIVVGRPVTKAPDPAAAARAIVASVARALGERGAACGPLPAGPLATGASRERSAEARARAGRPDLPTPRPDEAP